MGHLLRKLNDDAIYLIKLVHPVDKNDSGHLLTKLNELAQTIEYQESLVIILDTSQIPTDKFSMMRFIKMLAKLHSRWYTKISLELGIIATAWHLPSVRVMTESSFAPFTVIEDLSEITSDIYQNYGETKLFDSDESATI